MKACGLVETMLNIADKLCEKGRNMVNYSVEIMNNPTFDLACGLKSFALPVFILSLHSLPSHTTCFYQFTETLWEI